MLPRPDAGEYADYYQKYISLVPVGDILGILEAELRRMTTLLAARSEREGDFRYAPDKWSVKEVLGHVSDTERIFAYRVLRISRNDKTPIEGFEQDDYVKFAPFAKCKLAEIADEFAQVRRASLALFRSLDEEAWLRRGIANKNEVTVRALAYIIAGHAMHHAAILQDRYFPAIPRA